MSILEFEAHMAIYNLMSDGGYTEEEILLGLRMESLEYPEHLENTMIKILKIEHLKRGL